MVSERACVEIIVGIGPCVVRYSFLLVAKWMDGRRTGTTVDRSAIDTERPDSHTRLGREPYDDRNP